VTFVSYAQNFEDVILWRALGDVKQGHYIDIGAQDPVIDSVSLAFYEAGWRGIHVEATPFYASKLREARPDEVVIEAAVTQAPGPISFFEIPGTGISTGRPDIANHHAKIGYKPRKISTAAIRLEQLLERATPDLHWMKIDVEGMEADVLRSWGDCESRPWVLVIESTFPNTQQPTQDSWIDEVLKRGYKKVYFDGLSCYFVHRDHRRLASRFKTPANVFDAFAIAPHHFSAVQIRAQLDATKQRLDLEWARAERLDSEIAIVRTALDAAREQERSTLERLVAAEAAHRGVVESLAASHRDVESTLRRQALESEQQYTAARIELARLEERSEQLRERLDRAETSVRLHEQKRGEASEELERVRAAMGSEIATLRATGAHIDKLIGSVLAERPSRWQQAGEALGLARRGLAWRELERWSLSRRNSLQPSQQSIIEEAESTMQTDASMSEQDASEQAKSLAELLSSDDQEFVRLAYLTALGRPADTEGEAYYTDRIRRGHTKMEVLDQLRKGDEAKRVPSLPDLEAALRRFQIARVGLGKRKAGAAVERHILRMATQVRIDHFMRYHDEEFVVRVFAYYLGREPDEIGLAHYLHQIRSGVSRQRVLFDISRGAEARARGKRAVGENAIATAVLIDRIPVVRELVAFLRFNLHLRRYLRDMRALENHLYRLSKNLH
jgi:FkbM family methyltransferase